MIGSVERLSGRVVQRGLMTITIALAVVISLAFSTRIAVADATDDLVKQAESSSDKERLAATVALTKGGDPRAILALAKRVNADLEDETTVRQAAASGLGQLVKSTTKSSYKKIATTALQKAVSLDPSSAVQKEAAKSLTAITGSAAGSAASSGAATNSSGGIYVNVGPMSDSTNANQATHKGWMTAKATKQFGKSASTWVTAWPGGKAPTKKELDAKKMAGFYIDGTLNTLTVTKAGADATVACKISMLLATYPNKDIVGNLSGGAKVVGGNKPKDIALSEQDCIEAVIEDMVKTKVVPTIKSKTGTP